MTRTTLGLVALGLFSLGCNSPDATAPTSSKAPVAPLFNAGGVVHRATVGSYDILPPGADANFSLVALELPDGRMIGEWHDQLSGGVPIHVDVNCLQVVGNEAWISGIVKNGPFTGLPAITRVADNGTSANEPPDQVSFTFVGVATPCTAMPPLPLFPLGGGEVKVE